MKVYKSKTGPFREKPFYTNDEIEQLCSEELQSVGLLPTEPSPIRIDRFIEKRFKINTTYEELPEGVLGFIEFSPEGVKGITVSKALADEETKVAERRISTTLAHEAGHGLLHAHLFVLGQAGSLFGKEVDIKKPKILCRNNSVQGITVHNNPRYEWWEYQANLTIGPLLMPKSLVITALEPFLEKKGVTGSNFLDRTHYDTAVKTLAETFDVNPIVAKIRIEALFPAVQDRQLTL